MDNAQLHRGSLFGLWDNQTQEQTPKTTQDSWRCFLAAGELAQSTRHRLKAHQGWLRAAPTLDPALCLYHVPTTFASISVTAQAFCLPGAFWTFNTPENRDLTLRNSVMQSGKHFRLCVSVF